MLREGVFYGGPGAPDGDFDLAIYDPRQDIPAVRLTGISYTQACGGMGASCTKAELAKQAASKKKLDPVLASVGFEKLPTAWVSTTGEDGSSRDVITSPDKSISLELSEADGHAKIRRGKATVTVELSGCPQQIEFAGRYVVFQFRETARRGKIVGGAVFESKSRPRSQRLPATVLKQAGTYRDRHGAMRGVHTASSPIETNSTVPGVEEVPYVNVQITRGASREQKAKLIADITQSLVTTLGKKPEHIHVVLQEIDEQDWGFAGLPTDRWKELQSK